MFILMRNHLVFMLSIHRFLRISLKNTMSRIHTKKQAYSLEYTDILIKVMTVPSYTNGYINDGGKYVSDGGKLVMGKSLYLLIEQRFYFVIFI